MDFRLPHWNSVSSWYSVVIRLFTEPRSGHLLSNIRLYFVNVRTKRLRALRPLQHHIDWSRNSDNEKWTAELYSPFVLASDLLSRIIIIDPIADTVFLRPNLYGQQLPSNALWLTAEHAAFASVALLHIDRMYFAAELLERCTKCLPEHALHDPTLKS